MTPKRRVINLSWFFVDGDYGFKKEALACIATRPRLDGHVLARLQLVCVRETE